MSIKSYGSSDSWTINRGNNSPRWWSVPALTPLLVSLNAPTGVTYVVTVSTNASLADDVPVRFVAGGCSSRSLKSTYSTYTSGTSRTLRITGSGNLVIQGASSPLNFTVTVNEYVQAPAAGSCASESVYVPAYCTQRLFSPIYADSPAIYSAATILNNNEISFSALYPAEARSLRLTPFPLYL